LKELLARLARALVTEPERVAVYESEERGRTLLELEVSPGDLGRVIGRGGRTAAALRTVLDAVAVRNRAPKCTLEILE
jgi:predicted RNA-binding protein YlqC (UPF0109 family)